MPVIEMVDQSHMELAGGFPKFTCSIPKKGEVHFVKGFVCELLDDLGDCIDLELVLHETDTSLHVFPELRPESSM